MTKATVITQSKEWLLNRAIELGFYNHPNFQHDFLTTGESDSFGESEKYLFKHVSFADVKEVRIFKKSKRVTVSIHRTKK